MENKKEKRVRTSNKKRIRKKTLRKKNKPGKF